MPSLPPSNQHSNQVSGGSPWGDLNSQDKASFRSGENNTLVNLLIQEAAKKYWPEKLGCSVYELMELLDALFEENPDSYREVFAPSKEKLLQQLGKYGPGCTVSSEELWSVVQSQNEDPLFQRNAIAALTERGDTQGVDGRKKLLTIICGKPGYGVFEAAVEALTPDGTDLSVCAGELAKRYFDRASTDVARVCVVKWFLRIGEGQQEGAPRFIACYLGIAGLDEGMVRSLSRKVDAGKLDVGSVARPFIEAKSWLLEGRYPVLRILSAVADESPTTFLKRARECLLSELKEDAVRLPEERHAKTTSEISEREGILRALKTGDYSEQTLRAAAQGLLSDRPMITRMAAAVLLSGSIDRSDIVDEAFSPLFLSNRVEDLPLLAVALAYHIRHGFATREAAEAHLTPLLSTDGKPLYGLRNTEVVIARAFQEGGQLFDKLEDSVTIKLLTSWLNTEAELSWLLGKLTAPACALVRRRPAEIGTIFNAIINRIGDGDANLTEFFRLRLDNQPNPAANDVGLWAEEYIKAFGGIDRSGGVADYVGDLFAPLLHAMGEPGKKILRSWFGAENKQLHELGLKQLCEEVTAGGEMQQRAVALLQEVVSSGTAERADSVLWGVQKSDCLAGNPELLRLVFAGLRRQEEAPRFSALACLDNATEDVLLPALPALLYSLRDPEGGNKSYAKFILKERLPADKVGLLEVSPQLGTCSLQDIEQGRTIEPPLSYGGAALSLLRWLLWPKEIPLQEWHHSYKGSNHKQLLDSLEAGYRRELAEIREYITQKGEALTIYSK